jgi:HNH endonuclease
MPFQKGNQINKGRKPTNAFSKGCVPWNKKPFLKFICRNCQKEYQRPQWIINQNKGKTDFCSKKCHSLYWKNFYSGKNNPYWVGGKMTYRGRDWLIQRGKVIIQCKGYCEKCNKFVGKSIPIHHKIPYRNGRINHLSNLIALCQSCHMKSEYQK